VAQVVATLDRPYQVPEAKSDNAPCPVVEPISMTLVIETMRCGGCIRGIERTLNAVPGVLSARANLSTKRVVVLASPQLQTPEPCLEALEHAGFPAVSLADAYTAQRVPSQTHYLKRLGVAGFAATNIMLLSVSVWSGHGSDMPTSLQTMFHWLSALIALPAIAYAGQPFFASARTALAARRLNMDVPISLGVTLATAMSLLQTMRGSEQVYFDAAITLLFFLLAGRALDERVRAQTSSAAANLLGLQVPVTVVVRMDGTVERMTTAHVMPGTRILIAAGERVPLDARVTRGCAEVDESLITGESRPRHVGPGEQLYAGTVALTGPLEADATALIENTVLADISRLMQTAEQARGRYVRLADRAAQLYAPTVHILGAVTFVGWMLAGRGWEPALTSAIAVLIITCPCALALAVPVVQVVAAGRLLRRGIILKAADGLERMAEIDTIVFDKTGTLTLGRPQLSDWATLPAHVLGLAARLASQSRHPYAKAVVEAAGRRHLPVAFIPGVEEIGGSGLQTRIEGRHVRLGSAAFCDVDLNEQDQQTLWFKDGAEPAVAFPVTDLIRSDAVEVVTTLARLGYHVEILSGDQATAVADTARAVGIRDWKAGQHPEQKIRHLDALRAQGRKILMVGDGLNDAPALAAAHAALSPSTAADVSQNAADAVFQGDVLAPVVEILAVAKAARRRALENFGIAIGYNVLFVPLAMIGEVTPLIAAIAMSASSIAVTANSLRLTHKRAQVSP
jgi:P-type Cu2+ transporter